MNNEFLCLEATVDQDIFAEPFFFCVRNVRMFIFATWRVHVL